VVAADVLFFAVEVLAVAVQLAVAVVEV